jgi:hypothetical protein
MLALPKRIKVMTTSADTTSRVSSVEKFYQDYISHSEELRAAIQRQEWPDIERYVLWREEKLGELNSLPTDTEPLKEVHQEYLNRIMVLELANINSLNEVMESLKSLIRQSSEQKLIARYAENA